MAARPLLYRFIVIAGLALLCPGAASAQVAKAAQERIRLLNSQAMEQYDVLEFDSAKELLEKAMAEAEKYDLTADSSMARTHLNLGVVYGAGFNDRLNAVKHFTEALKLDKNAALDPMRATPTLEEIFSSAKENVPPPKKKDLSLKHQPRDDIQAGNPITLMVTLGEDLKAAEVVAYYWSTGTPKRTRLPLREVKPRIYRAQIPAAKVQGKSIYYFIEVQDELGQRVQGHGSKGSPNIISVTGGGAVKPPGGKKGDDKGDDKGGILSVYVLLGAGFGVVHGGESEHTHLAKVRDETTGLVVNGYRTMEIQSGGAIAPFHMAPELAFHINEKWHIGAMVRIQFVNAISDAVTMNMEDNTLQKMSSRVSVLGLVRARRFFLDGPLKLYVAFGAGGGQIRHRIELGDYDGDANKPIDPKLKTPDDHVDARLAQYVAFNVGGGLKYMFHKNVGVALDLTGIIMVPDFAAHLDVNVGPVISF